MSNEIEHEFVRRSSIPGRGRPGKSLYDELVALIIAAGPARAVKLEGKYTGKAEAIRVQQALYHRVLRDGSVHKFHFRRTPDALYAWAEPKADGTEGATNDNP